MHTYTVEGRFYPGTPLPTVVHYCQSFISGEFGFEKRAVPHDLFSCESPMLMDPPEGLAKKVYMVKKKNMKKSESAADRVGPQTFFKIVLIGALLIFTVYVHSTFLEN